MKYASFFSGIGGFELALDAADHERVFGCEIDEFCGMVYGERFSRPFDARDIREVDPARIPDADVWVGGFPCFPPETPVTTERGEQKIEEVKAGDRVLTHLGRYRRVMDVGARPYNGDLVRIKATAAFPFRATPNHPLLVRRQHREWENETRSWRRVLSDPEWIPAEKITQGMMLRIPAPVEADRSLIPFGINLDPDFWWIIGFWLAEGWRKRTTRIRDGREANDYRVTFACNDVEHNRVSLKIGKYFRVVHDRGKTVWKLIVVNESLWKLLKSFGDGASNKRIPSWVYALPKECGASLLEGYLDGDGWRKSDGMWQTITVSKELARGVQSLAFLVDRRMPTVFVNNVARVSVIEGRIVSCREAYMVRQFPRSRSTVNDEVGAWVVVREVSKERYEGNVYNMEVEDDHTYTAGAVAVHNCQDLSVAGKRGGIKANRSGLVWQLLRLAEVRRPKWCVLENVPGLLSSHGGADFWLLLTRMSDLWPAVGWRVLDAQFVGVPQRRRRIFIVGGPGTERVSSVLFEPPRRRGDPEKGGEAGKDAAYCLRAEPSRSGDKGDGGINTTLVAFDGNNQPKDKTGTLVGAEKAGGRNDLNLPLVAGCVNHMGNGGTDDNEAQRGLLIVEGDSAASTPDLPRLRAGCGRAGETAIASAVSASAGHHGHSSPRGDGQDNLVVGPTVTARQGKGGFTDPENDGIIVAPCVEPVNHDQTKYRISCDCGGPEFIGTLDNPCPSCGEIRGGHTNEIAPTLREHVRPGSNSDLTVVQKKDGPIPFDPTQITHGENRSNPKPGDHCHSLAAGAHPPAIASPITPSNLRQPDSSDRDGGPVNLVAASLSGGSSPNSNAPGRHHEDDENIVAFNPQAGGSHARLNPSEKGVDGISSSQTPAVAKLAPTLSTKNEPASSKETREEWMETCSDMGMAVRRLTPTECERLQGFPDGHTCLCGVRPDCPDRRIPPWVDHSKVKLNGCGHSVCGCKCADSPRYRALGNAVAVPVVKWVADRMAATEKERT